MAICQITDLLIYIYSTIWDWFISFMLFVCSHSLILLKCMCISIYYGRLTYLKNNDIRLLKLKISLHFKVNFIIIIMSRRQRGYPWPSLATSPYHSSPPAGLQGYILCPHIVAVCMFVLVVPLLHILYIFRKKNGLKFWYKKIHTNLE